MTVTIDPKALAKEMADVSEVGYQLGTYLYLGMCEKDRRKICVAVGYKIDYCLKKLNQFLEDFPTVKPVSINKIRVGELESCEKYPIQNV